MRYNVISSTGMIMLGLNVYKAEADKAKDYYRTTYPVGKPYPNGKGFYFREFYVINMDTREIESSTGEWV